MKLEMNKPMRLLLLLSAFLLPPKIQAENLIEAENAVISGAPLAQFQHLAAHPLYPYLEAQELRRNLPTLPAEKIIDFLHRNPRAPFSTELARSAYSYWNTRGEYKNIITSYHPEFADTEVECQWRQALLSSGRSKEAADGIRDLYVTAKSLPTACDPLIAQMSSAGVLTRQMIGERFRKAMNEGEFAFAQSLRPWLGEANPDAQAADTWIAIRRQNLPISALSSIQNSSWRAAAIGDIFYRQGKEQAFDAVNIALQEKNTGVFRDAEAAAYLGKGLSRVVAKLAQDNNPAAEQIFELIPAEYHDKNPTLDLIAYQIRSNRYPQMINSLEKLGAKEGNNAEYQYWLGKACEKTNQKDKAQSYYRMAAAKRDFFGFLAAEKLNISPNFNDRPVVRDAIIYPQVMSYPEIYRWKTFLRLGLNARAEQEFSALTRKMSPEQTRIAALLAVENGQGFNAITLLAKAKDWDALSIRFPVMYETQIRALASKNGISPATVLAIIRKESTFRPAIKSKAGAIGLMQVMPATASHTASKYGIPYAGAHQLTVPEVNLEIGTKYLAARLEQYGHLAYAAAAYNAGPARVAQWKENYPTLPLDEWIAEIPFYETRDYVKRVLEYERIYEYLLKMPYKPYSSNKTMRFW